MKYQSFLFFITFHVLAMEKVSYDANDSVGHKLKKALQYKSWQIDHQNQTVYELIQTFYALKYLHALERECPQTRTTRQLWQFTNFYHWLNWYQSALSELIKNIARQENYYDRHDTILHSAVFKGEQMLRFILAAGITPQLFKYTTFHSRLSLDTAEFLIKNGEDINKLDKGGYHILHFCDSCAFQPELLEFCLEQNADTSFACGLGTALHWLAHEPYHSSEIEKCLKKNSAIN